MSTHQPSWHLSGTALDDAALKALAHRYPDLLANCPYVPDDVIVSSLDHMVEYSAARLISSISDPGTVGEVLRQGERRGLVVTAVCVQFALGTRWQELLINEANLSSLLGSRPWTHPMVTRRLYESSTAVSSDFAAVDSIAAQLWCWEPHLSDAEVYELVTWLCAGGLRNDEASLLCGRVMARRPHLHLDLVEAVSTWQPLSRVCSPEAARRIIDKVKDHDAGPALRLDGWGGPSGVVLRAVANIADREDLDHELRRDALAALMNLSSFFALQWRVPPPGSSREALSTRDPMPGWDVWSRVEWLLSLDSSTLGPYEALMAYSSLQQLANVARRCMWLFKPKLEEIECVHPHTRAAAPPLQSDRVPPGDHATVYPTNTPSAQAPEPVLDPEGVMVLGSRPSTHLDDSIEATSGLALVKDMALLPSLDQARAWSACSAYVHGRLRGPREELHWTLVWELIDQFPGSFASLCDTVIATTN